MLRQVIERVRNAHTVARNHIFCVMDRYKGTSLLHERSSLRDHNRECVFSFLFPSRPSSLYRGIIVKYRE